jgi:isoquinoline 1-oxidoreductase beta subunit
MVKHDLSRRDFLKAAGAVSGSFLLGFWLPEARAATTVATQSGSNAWVQIDPDNRITILCARSEMGQGVSTAMPMLVAEELEVDLDQIEVAFAPAQPIFTNQQLGAQQTGGSTSVQDAWQTLRVAGATTRTMLVQAAAQRWGVSPDVCRAERGEVVGPTGQRLSYGALAADAVALPVPKRVTLKAPADFRLVGKPTRRLDTPAKVNGTATFGSDVRLPGMLYAALAQCPVLGGAPKQFDASRAGAMPGVRQVVQISDGVAVVADTFWQALKARDMLTVEWDEGPAAALSSASISADLKQAAASPGATALARGNITQAFAAAAQTLDAVYELPFLAHATMEPMNFTADVRPDGADVYGGTQIQSGDFPPLRRAPGAATSAQAVTAKLCGLKPEQVRVHTTFMGGAFGRRTEIDFVRQAVEISRAVGRPVQLQWTRPDDMQNDFYRPATYDAVRAALDANGNFTAFQRQVTSPFTLGPANPTAVGDFLYDTPNVKVTYRQRDVGVRTGAWRSVKDSTDVFVSESFMDEIAHAAGRDPYEYRHERLTHQPRLKAVLELAADKAGWGQPPPGRFQGIAAMTSYESSFLAQVAEISVDTEGKIRVHRVVCAVDCGMMVNPDGVVAQVEGSIIFGLSAALYGEITIEAGRVQQSTFKDYPVVRMNESPAIEVYFVPSTQPPGGMGEPGTALIGPAVANAVFQATGRRVRRLPLRPEWVRG